jgi:head-tail adaptor
VKNMRHVVTVMRPAEAQDDAGQKKNATVYRADVPCSIEHLSGREAEKARAIYPEATLKVEMYGNPLKPVSHKDWLKHGERKLFIGDIDDHLQSGQHGPITLLCGEEPK